MDKLTPAEVHRIKVLDEILMDAADQYNRVAGPALMEKQAIIGGRRTYDVEE